ncbi:hypothetical protein [Amycolatopsis sp. lyj-346]|uniref:hypothetical protein n=1 Tax=Amycolatopsis sp. lyj-346 TaxID=2789289 RepID=UPI00397A5006
MHSEAGAPCVLRPGIDGDLAVTDARGRARRWRRLANGDVQVELGCGEDAFVFPKGDRPDFGVRPVAPGGASVPWGLP